MNFKTVFDLSNAMFKFSDIEWSKVTKYEKEKYFFMINKFFSIKYPTQANYFNLLNISTSNVIDNWRIVAKKHNGRIPSWMFTKIDNKNKIKKEKFDQNVLDLFKELNEISNRELNEFINFFPDESNIIFKKLSKIIQTSSK